MKLLLAAILMVLLSAAPAFAASCGSSKTVLSNLKKKYGETVRGRGLIDARRVLVLTVSPSGSWSVVIINVSGRACVYSVGEAWQDVAPPVPGVPG